MKVLVLVIVLVAACSDSGGNYPVLPGSGPGIGGGGVTPDAGGGYGDAADASTQLTGKVCLLTDLRDLTSCAPTGAGGLTVTLGGTTATTMDDGSFTMAIPTGSNLVWSVTGATIVTSSMSFGTNDTIPAIDATAYATMESSNGVVPQAGQGDIMVSVTEAGAATAGATATVNPPIAGAILYDGASSDAWTQSATGALGTIWVPGEAAGSATVSITPMGATGATDVTGIGVIDGAITFVRFEAM